MFTQIYFLQQCTSCCGFCCAPWSYIRADLDDSDDILRVATNCLQHCDSTLYWRADELIMFFIDHKCCYIVLISLHHHLLSTLSFLILLPFASPFLVSIACTALDTSRNILQRIMYVLMWYSSIGMNLELLLPLKMWLGLSLMTN